MILSNVIQYEAHFPLGFFLLCNIKMHEHDQMDMLFWKADIMGPITEESVGM